MAAATFSAGFAPYLTPAERQEVTRLRNLHRNADRASKNVKRVSKSFLDRMAATGDMLAQGCFSPTLAC